MLRLNEVRELAAERGFRLDRSDNVGLYILVDLQTGRPMQRPDGRDHTLFGVQRYLERLPARPRTATPQPTKGRRARPNPRQ